MLRGRGGHRVGARHLKGPNFFSCDASQFADGGTTIMSVVYAPGDGHAWVSWEDATPQRTEWVPAACNPYVRIDLKRFW